MPASISSYDHLLSLGASAETARQLLAQCDTPGHAAVAARVRRVDRARALVATSPTDQMSVRPGAHALAVGDWCVVRLVPAAQGAVAQGAVAQGELLAVLPRRTELVRRATGSATAAHVLAANVDVVLIALPLDRPLARRQLERLCALTWESGARAVVLLTKADLATEAECAAGAADVLSVSPDLTPCLVSATVGTGLADVLAQLPPGTTAVLLGGSGAGKSTLVKALAGAAVATGQVREGDAKGRHTTTWRELVMLPSGAALIDTPGLRGLGLWLGTDGISALFADIDDAGCRCRFSDCAHVGEPGCAVAAAIDSGDLDPDRLASYRKLQREAAHVARQHDQRLAADQLQHWKRLTKERRGRNRP